jgi:probable HAF family extracellular repeat protein
VKSKTLANFIVAALIVAPAIGRSVAQEQPAKHPSHRRYKFVDLGTFGGPASYFPNGFDGFLNNHGTAAGWADTSAPDPHPGFCSNLDCFVSHAFRWHDGVRTDLGTLPGGSSSQAFWISRNGLIAGNSQNGEIDPLITGLPEIRAVLWKDDKIINLGTLEGGNESLASAVNSRGQVVGALNNAVPDPFSLVGDGYQVRAYLWQDGAMEDLGTLGGPDAFAFFVNERGQVTGQSYTSSVPNPVSGIPTADPFFWEDGRMIDVGTLGGTSGSPTALNNRGEVVGQSNLAGDLITRPFLWTKSQGIQDLGTLGGDTGFTNWINDAGDIVGKTDLAGPLSPQDHHAVLWTHGVINDLGTLPGDSSSNAYFVNDRGEVVGTSEDRAHMLIGVGEHAFLWENGGPMIDLNSLIPASSSLQLTYAVAINDRGEIAGFGVPPGVPPEKYETEGHAYILVPCDENHADSEGCEDRDVGPTSAKAPNSTGSAVAPDLLTLKQGEAERASATDGLREGLAHRYHVFGTGMPQN